MYVPGVTNWLGARQGGIDVAHAGLMEDGTENVRCFPSDELKYGNTPVPKLTLFVVEAKPDPVIIAWLPTTPAIGKILVIRGPPTVPTPPAPTAVFNATRVFGPTTPYPVVLGVPDVTIPCAFCHRCNASSVFGPKYPVTDA